jgi:ADP-heptose:LPS heptosyltransferase
LEFSCWLQNQKLLVGPDSMAVHLAVALDVPSLSIFGSQNPNLTRPWEPHGHIVQPKLSCTHKRNNWRLCSRCLASIKPKKVHKKIIEIIPKR